MLSDGHLLISNYPSKCLIEYSDEGEFIRNIPVTCMPYGIAVIDPYRVVATYVNAKFIEITNNKSFHVEKKIIL